MKIGLVNFTPMEYDVETPYHEPLGGSESALCYLAEALAKRGHEITLFRRIKGEFGKLGVQHKYMNALEGAELDVLIMQNTPSYGFEYCAKLKPRTKLILWAQHASDQPAVQPLKDKSLQEAFDKIVLISDYQVADYVNAFGMDLGKIVVLHNAISPAFENWSGKKKPWSMAYTSTPFRGLNLLGEIFPRVRAVHPEATLKIFSGMKVYQGSDEVYQPIYDQLKQIEGVSYVGPLSQRELAKRMSEIAILAYPNTFAETSCTAVLEAMATGCQVVTSELGALSETTAGYGRLVPIIGQTKGEYIERFVQELLKPIEAKNMEAQVAHINRDNVWRVRAKEWERLLSDIVKE